MKVRRCSPPTDLVGRAAAYLRQSEAQIALLDRVRPLNLAAEQARLLRGFEAGQRPSVAFEYAPRPNFTELRRELVALAQLLAQEQEPEKRLLSERALELELEAALSERVGRDDFAELARRRFPLPEGAGRVQQLTQSLAAGWPGEMPPDPAEPLHVSHDQRDPDSLWSELSRRISRERWPIRVELVAGLVSLAAVAEGVVRVRAGARLTAGAGRRIALHELEGHVRPRVGGAALGGVFLAASSGASQDEEGRAILLEERAGVLDAERRRELARRFWAAESLRDGAEFWDTVDLLGRHGATAPSAVELACRVHRGGGLGRELIYLAGYQRVATALGRRPELEHVLQSGRLSIEAAETLLAGSIELDDDGDMV